MKEVRECCGLFGAYGTPDAVSLTYSGLYAQQHRGQESAGIASIRDGRIQLHKAMGLVADVFDANRLRELSSSTAIGHVRYSTTGSSNLANTQPILMPDGQLAIAHNGNLVNSAQLRGELESKPGVASIFQSTTDTEIILCMVANGGDLIESLKRALPRVQGAFSLLFLTPKQMIAVRDPQGFRPLCLGRKNGAWMVASETCAFDLAGIEYVRDVEPGEILVIDEQGPRSFWFKPREECRPQHCAFEHVYFARPDSRVFGDTVHLVRKRLGNALANEHPVQADLVTPIPDSGTAAALGYSQTSGIPFEMCFIRNHYVGRTFIQPNKNDRSSSVSMKLAVVRETVQGKRIIVVDDSVIRGTTSRSRIRLLREAGAKEIHLRISCPPSRSPCFYGIDFPTREELIAANKSVEEIREHIGVDTLGYLSIEGMLGALSKPKDQYCTSCWTGRYPIAPVDTMDKTRLERR